MSSYQFEPNQSSDISSLLVVLIDTNPYVWSKRQSNSNLPTFQEVCDQILIFLNSYLLLHHSNILAVLEVGIEESRYLYLTQNTQERKHEGLTRSFEQIKSKIVSSLKINSKEIGEKLMNKDYSSKMSLEKSREPMLSGALSLALCYINRMCRPNSGESYQPRILVFNASPDVSTQYIPFMNCIFCAQKEGIPVDTCILSPQDSSFLQQASHLTGGLYVKPVTKNTSLLQTLLSVILVDGSCRKLLKVPKLSSVDFRAACFCHKQMIDMGWVCSVCLSIFCRFIPVCTTCNSKFPLTGPKPLKPKITTTTTTTEEEQEEEDEEDHEQQNNSSNFLTSSISFDGINRKRQKLYS